MYHALTKLCSPNFYFAPITCCLAHTTKGVYYHAILVLLLTLFVNIRRGLALQCSSCTFLALFFGVVLSLHVHFTF